MKCLIAALVFATASSSLAFAPMQPTTSAMRLRMSAETDEATETAKNVVDEMPPPSEKGPQEKFETAVEPTKRGMSQALPFLERPAGLDTVDLVGDVGFDPVGFAKTKEDLLNYREAEIKHGRLAMLAAAGWPISELFDTKIANLLGLPPVLQPGDRAPSILNGGLGKISPLYWVACLAAAAAIDLYGIKLKKDNGYNSPGELGFDPLGLYPKDEEGQKIMKLKELKNGRLAMIAITAFAFQEFVQKVGVVDETPIFFKPINTVIQEYANFGYATPH